MTHSIIKMIIYSRNKLFPIVIVVTHKIKYNFKSDTLLEDGIT